MRFSASQLSTGALCKRKWLLGSILKCREPSKGNLVLGRVFHGVCERFLKGEPLYPEGWSEDPDKKGPRLAPVEAALVKVLIEEGIKNGYLERRPGGIAEQESLIPIVDGHEMIIKIDYQTKDRIEDHKTSKSETYLKTSKKLKVDMQMLIYAKKLLHDFLKRGEVPTPFITLCHNQFIVDPDAPTTRRREAEVTPDEVNLFWNQKVIPLVRELYSLRNTTNPFDIPEPGPDACNAFGGCGFMPICSGAETVLTYKSRTSKPAATTMTTPVSPNAFLSSRLGGAPAAAAAVSVNPPKPAAAPAAPAAAAPAQAAGKAPPWTWDTCPMCARSAFPGFNATTKKPCRICVGYTKVDIELYDYAADATGKLTWGIKGQAPVAEAQATGAPVDAGSKTVYGIAQALQDVAKCLTVDSVIELLEVAQESLGESAEMNLLRQHAEKRMEQIDAQPATATTDPNPTVIETIPAKEAAPAAPVKRPRGRPKGSTKKAAAEKVALEGVENTEPTEAEAGIALMIGCNPIKWEGREVIFAEEVLHRLDGYWQNDKVFERRDQLRKILNEGGDFLGDLDGLLIVQTVANPDVDNLISALVPFATIVIRGTL